MEFEAAGWYIGKHFRLDETVRDLSCGNWESLFVVIRLGATSLEQSGFVYFQDLFEGRGGKGCWCGLIVCGVLLDDWVNCGYVDVLLVW